MKMYDKIFHFKFLPPGRGLWAMGTQLTEETELYAALNNCAFVSTKEKDVDKFIDAFAFLMDSSMIGVGVGFDTKGEKLHTIYPPTGSNTRKFVIPDSREGWVESIRLQLESYLKPNMPVVEFDYSVIRPAGLPLKKFGGTSSGPSPLIYMHKALKEKFDSAKGKQVTSRDIVDIMNMIGKCVIAGNIRRVAEIALGEANDSEFINLKDYSINPDRVEYGWVSNNSIFADIGMNYDLIAEKIRLNGEPGLCWLDNMRAYGRMADPPNYRDKLAAGGNPCLE